MRHKEDKTILRAASGDTSPRSKRPHDPIIIINELILQKRSLLTQNRALERRLAYNHKRPSVGKKARKKSAATQTDGVNEETVVRPLPSEPSNLDRSRKTEEKALLSMMNNMLIDQTQHVKILQNQYHSLKEKAQVQRRLYEQALAKCSTVTEENIELNQRLCDIQSMTQTHRNQAQFVQDLQQEVHILRKENSQLSQVIDTLSVRPFQDWTTEMQKKSLQLAALQAELEEAFVREKTLKHAKSSSLNELQIQKERAKRLESDLESTTKELDQIRVLYEQQSMALELSRFQLRFYTNPKDKAIMSQFGRFMKEMMRTESCGKDELT